MKFYAVKLCYHIITIYEAGTRELRPVCATVSEGSSSEVLDESRMSRVCDKLIGVFMVDKPTPTDWRRLLAFSREWDNLRPHFFARCRERIDAEDDPAMKEKLLRLSRKLKQVSFWSYYSIDVVGTKYFDTTAEFVDQ